MHPVFFSLFFNTLSKVLSPLNLGSKDGCMLIIFFPEFFINFFEIIFIYPARQIIDILYQDYESSLTLFSFMAEWDISQEIKGGAVGAREYNIKLVQIIKNIITWNELKNTFRNNPKFRAIHMISELFIKNGREDIALYTFNEYINKGDPSWLDTVKNKMITGADWESDININEILSFYLYVSRIEGKEIIHSGEEYLEDILEVKTFIIDPYSFIISNWRIGIDDNPPFLSISTEEEDQGYYDKVEKLVKAEEFPLSNELLNYIYLFFGYIGRWWVEFTGFPPELGMGGNLQGWPEWAVTDSKFLLNYFGKKHLKHQYTGSSYPKSTIKIEINQYVY